MVETDTKPRETQQAPEKRRVPERLGYQEGLVGLQTRLLIGGNALNPDYKIPELSSDHLTKSQEKVVTYHLLSQGSIRERKAFWQGRENNDFDNQMTVWRENTTNTFRNAQTFFQQSDRGKRWLEFFEGLGIRASNFTQKDAQEIYHRFFTSNKENNAPPFHRFMEHVVKSTLTPGNAVNHQKIRSNLDAIQWISNIFGEQSSEVTAQLLDAELKAGDEDLRTELLRQTNHKTNQGQQRANDLVPKEEKLLRFLWQGVPEDIQTLRPAPSGRRQPEESTPSQEPPEQGRENGRQPQGEEPEGQTTTAQQEPFEDKAQRLEQYFQQVIGLPQSNHKFWISDPPERIPIDKKEAKNLQSKLPFLVKATDKNGEPFLGANEKVVPWAWELGPKEERNPNGKNNQRFINGEAATNGDSGLFGVAAASSDTPEKQARLYKTLSQAVLDVHKFNPKLLKEWLQAQKKTIKMPDGKKMAFGMFVKNEHTEEKKLRPENERLLYWDKKDKLREDAKHYKTDKPNEFWGRRLQELEQALNQNQLFPYHLRWIEFLSHSVDVPSLFELAREPQEQPGPQNQPEPEAQQTRKNILKRGMQKVREGISRFIHWRKR